MQLSRKGFGLMNWKKIWVFVLLSLPATNLSAQSQAENPLGLKPHHITASAVDLDRAVKWYVQMLGFKVIERGSRQNGAFQFAEMKAGTYGVALIQLRTPSPVSESVANTPRWIHQVFSVADPDKVYKILMKRGAKITTAEGDPVRSFLVYDTEGNEIEILADEPPAKK
jgi:catechol 2,3-dioxygenase-like lactoylglutathione lyase family enzyme